MVARTISLPESSQKTHTTCAAIITGYAIAAPGANTAIPFIDAGGTSVTTFKVGAAAVALRLTVSLATGSVFNLHVTDGTTAYTQKFNGGTALTAGVLYTFTVGARRYSTNNNATELTYDFQVATDGIIQTLFVEEVSGGVV